jgi:2-methoxy-6-polyprenyl-1,4-benzoquinol methylase
LNLRDSVGAKIDSLLGDIAMRFLDYCKNIHNDSSASVKMIDINPHMLKVGEQRFQSTPYANSELRIIIAFVQSMHCISLPLILSSIANQVSFLVQNAEDLADIPDESVDVYTIAFGIRNCTHIDRVVKEAHRVLKKGGRFMCLEFSHVENPVVSK